MRLIQSLVILTVSMRLLPAVTIVHSQPQDFTISGQAGGNPFDVEVKGEFTGPDGTRITVPGFYAGGNIWKIRFSATKPGRWSMTTVSPIAALNAHTETDIQCTANSNPNIHGALLVDPVNRHHFMYEDGSRYFLMGYEADWLWGADLKDPERKVMHHLIDQMAARGFNHLLVNIYAYDTTW